MKQKTIRDGYSLVEMLIASALTAIVLAGLITLLAFGTRNMNRTQTRVALQNQAKDALRHMSTYIMEGNEVKWDDATKVLTVTKSKIKEDDTVEWTDSCYYWKKDTAIYFGKQSAGVDPTGVLPSDKQHLLADNITGFVCEIKKDEKTGKELVHVSMRLKDGDAEFACDKDIYMRNQ